MSRCDGRGCLPRCLGEMEGVDNEAHSLRLQTQDDAHHAATETASCPRQSFERGRKRSRALCQPHSDVVWACLRLRHYFHLPIPSDSKHDRRSRKLSRNTDEKSAPIVNEAKRGWASPRPHEPSSPCTNPLFRRGGVFPKRFINLASPPCICPHAHPRPMHIATEGVEHRYRRVYGFEDLRIGVRVPAETGRCYGSAIQCTARSPVDVVRRRSTGAGA